MKDKIINMLMDSLEKVKKKFDEAVQNEQPFEASTYSRELTEMSKALLEHYRAEYEANALEALMKKGGEKE